MKDPILLFSKWYNQELKLSKVRIPSAVCLSTIGVDNFPNSRFVSFKELLDDCFVITGPMNSRKGIEIENNDNVALTFWWTETERQVRIQGVAQRISEQLADQYFNERSDHSKAVSFVSEQGKEVENLETLEQKVINTVATNTLISRPKDWGGFSIQPIRIEFMEFKASRFHHRNLYEKKNGEWELKQIQP